MSCIFKPCLEKITSLLWGNQLTSLCKFQWQQRSGLGASGFSAPRDPKMPPTSPLLLWCPVVAATVLPMPVCALSQRSSRDHTAVTMIPLLCGVNSVAFEANSPSAHLCCTSSQPGTQPKSPWGVCIPKSRFWGWPASLVLPVPTWFPAALFPLTCPSTCTVALVWDEGQRGEPGTEEGD